MKLDKGTRIFTATTIKAGQKVWAPESYLDTPGWSVGVVKGEAFESGRAKWVYVVVDFVGNDLLAFPLWQLREHKPHLKDGGRPDEPIPPTIGRPRGNPATKRVGLLKNGDFRGRC